MATKPGRRQLESHLREPLHTFEVGDLGVRGLQYAASGRSRLLPLQAGRHLATGKASSSRRIFGTDHRHGATGGVFRIYDSRPILLAPHPTPPTGGAGVAA